MTPVLSFEPIREKRSRSPLLRVIKRSVSPFSRSFLVSMTPPPQGVAKTPKFKSKFYTERVLNPRKSEEEDTYLRDGLSARGLQILPHI